VLDHMQQQKQQVRLRFRAWRSQGKESQQLQPPSVHLSSYGSVLGRKAWPSILPLVNVGATASALKLGSYARAHSLHIVY
jgi:hypothetical protein